MALIVSLATQTNVVVFFAISSGIKVVKPNLARIGSDHSAY